jgi:RimJ/RimL family protein N-acetyltransferase
VSLATLESLPVLVRDGVRLREVHLSDAAALTTLFQRREVSQHLDPPPATIPDMSSWITTTLSRRAEGKAVCYTVITGTDEISGLFMSLRLEEADKAEIGFAMAPHLWGTGAFQRAIALFLDFLFNEWGIKTVIGKTQITNVRAVGVMRKLGAALQDEIVRNGHPEYVWIIEKPSR